MRIFNYMKTNFLSKDARHWWKIYIRNSQVLSGLFRFLLFCLLMQAFFFGKPIIALLAVWVISTLSFLYAIIFAAKKILGFVLTELYPNDALTGYFVIGFGGIIFGSLILIPTFFALAKVLNAPLNVFSYLITYSYAIPVWTFFEVMRSTRRGMDYET